MVFVDDLKSTIKTCETLKTCIGATKTRKLYYPSRKDQDSSESLDNSQVANSDDKEVKGYHFFHKMAFWLATYAMGSFYVRRMEKVAKWNAD